MAMIPKQIGHCCIAILSTFHRILVKIDRERLVDFEHNNAYANDTSRKGVSMADSSYERALKAELATIEGKHVAQMLWDIVKTIRFDRTEYFGI